MKIVVETLEEVYPSLSGSLRSILKLKVHMTKPQVQELIAEILDHYDADDVIEMVRLCLTLDEDAKWGSRLSASTAGGQE